MLTVGTKAPDFILLNEEGQEVSLSQFKGKKVLLYFYPKDNTPGCTKQACSYSANQEAFSQQDVVILGVSKDSVKSHQNFKTKQNLTITLLSDPETKVIQAYDVWKEKKNYGRTYMGVVRTTYLIDETGTIIFANDKVKAAEDATQMLAHLNA